jgi:hypothetical protein
MASEDQITEVLQGLAGYYDGRFRINEYVIDTWLQALNNCEFEYLKKSIQSWKEKSPKPPELSDIKAEALRLSGGSFYKKKDSDDINYNDPETCKVVFRDEIQDRWLSQRVAKRFLLKDGKGNLFYPLLLADQKVVF